MVNWLVIGIGDITRKARDPGDSGRAAQRVSQRADAVRRRRLRHIRAFGPTRLSRAALKDREVDAVYVASPVALHAQQTIAALRAGKHVLCEKPTAMNYAEAESMLAVAKETGRLFGVAFYRRLFPETDSRETTDCRGCDRTAGARLKRTITDGWRARTAAGCAIPRWRAAVRSTTRDRTALTRSIFCSARRYARPGCARMRCTSLAWKIPRRC